MRSPLGSLCDNLAGTSEARMPGFSLALECGSLLPLWLRPACWPEWGVLSKQRERARAREKRQQAAALQSTAKNLKSDERVLDHRSDLQDAGQVFFDYAEPLLGRVCEADEFVIVFGDGARLEEILEIDGAFPEA